MGKGLLRTSGASTSSPVSLTLLFNGGGATVGSAYSGGLQALGGTPAYTYSITTGLSAFTAAGFSLNATTGAITGTPTSASTITFTGKVVDSASNMVTIGATIQISIAAAQSESPFSVTVAELGSSRKIDLADQSTNTTLQVVIEEAITPTGGLVLGTQLHVQLSNDNGTTWYDAGQTLYASDRTHMDGTSTYWVTTINIAAVPVFGFAQTFKARAWSLTSAFDGGPATATASSAYTLTSVQPASATGLSITIKNAAGSAPSYGTGGTNNNIYMGTNSLGNPYAQVILTVTPPGAGDPNLWFYWAWLEWTDASGTAINPGGVANTSGWQNFAQFPNTGVAQQQNLLINYPAAGIDGYLKIEIWGMNRAYTATAAPFTGDSNAVLQTTWGTAGVYLLHVGPPPITPEAPASVSVSELGSSRVINLANQTTSTTLQVVVQEAITPGTTFTLGTQLHVQLSSDGGTTWYDAGQVIYASDRVHTIGSNYATTINITGVPVWGFSQSFQARAWAKGPSYDGGPAGAVASSTYTLTAVSPPLATGLVATIHNAAGVNPSYGTGGTNNNIYMGTNSLGNPYAQVILTVTPPGAGDPNLWFYWAWLEWTDASGTAINPGGVANTSGWQNFAQFPNTGVTQQQNLLINYPAVGVDGYLKLQIWGMNRAYSATAAPFTGDSNAVLQTTIGTSGVYLLHVGPPPGVTTPHVSFSAGAGAIVGTAFQGNTAVTGGVAPYSYAITTGLSAFTAAGFSLNATTGAVTGTPTAAGVIAIIITVTDAVGATGNVSCTIPVQNALTPLALNLVFQGGAAVIGSLYNGSVQALSGTGPYSYAITAGALPGGVTLGGSTSNTDPISGTPTASGTFTFTVKVTDSTSATATLACEIIVASYGALSASFSGAHAQVGILYSGSVYGTGGKAPYMYAVTGGALPVGLSLTTSGASAGMITGTPTLITVLASPSATVTVTDALGVTATVTFSITVAAAQTPAPVGNVSSVSAGVASTGINADQSTTDLILYTVNWAASYGSQSLTVWLFFRRSIGTAPAWYWQGTYDALLSGTSSVLNLAALVVPGASVTAAVAVLPGIYPGDSTVALGTNVAVVPSGATGATISNTFTMFLTAPSPTEATLSITNVAGSAPSYGSGGANNNIYAGVNTMQDPYAIVNATVTTPGSAAPNTWFYDVFCEWTDAVGNPISPGGVSNANGWQEGGQAANTGSVWRWSSGSLGVGLYINYPAPGVDGYLTFQVWARTRNSAGTVPFTGDSNAVLQQWPGGLTYYRLHVGPPPATLTGHGIANNVSTSNPTGVPTTTTGNSLYSAVPDYSFEYSSLGQVAITPGVSQWSYQPGSGGASAIVMNSGGNSGPNFVRLQGQNTGVYQYVFTSQHGAQYIQFACRSSNTAGPNHYVQMTIQAYDYTGAVVSVPPGGGSNSIQVFGYVPPWNAIGNTTVIQFPATVAYFLIVFSTSPTEPTGGYWDIDDILVQNVTNQQVSGQTNTQVPSSLTYGGSAIGAVSVTTTASSYYGLNQILLTGSSGEEVLAFVTGGTASIACGSAGPVSAQLNTSTTGANVQVTKSSGEGVEAQVASGAAQIVITKVPGSIFTVISADGGFSFVNGHATLNGTFGGIQFIGGIAHT